jgi:hypothetical protein
MHKEYASNNLKYELKDFSYRDDKNLIRKMPINDQ